MAAQTVNVESTLAVPAAGSPTSAQLDSASKKQLRPDLGIIFSSCARLLQSFKGGGLRLGVDMGWSHVKVAFVSGRPGGATRVKTAEVFVPPEVREDPAARKAFLRKWFKDYLRHSKVPFLARTHIALSGPDILTQGLLVPKGSAAELKQSIQAELAKDPSLKLEESMWNYYLPVTQETADGKQPVICVVAPSRTIEETIGLCEALQLAPAVISVPPYGLIELLRSNGTLATAQGLAILDLGYTRSTLLLIHAGSLEFVRTLPVALGDLSRKLARTVDTPRGPVTVSQAQAEQILRSSGVTTEEVHTSVEGLEASTVYNMLRQSLEQLLLETQRTLTYYQKSFQRAPLEKILVSGGGTLVPNLVEFFSANLEQTAIEPLASSKELSPHFSVAVGMGNAAGGKNPEAGLIFHRSAYWMDWMLWAGRWVAGAGLTVTLILTLLVQTQRLRYQGLVKGAQSRLDDMEPRVQEIEQFKKQNEMITQQETLLSKAVGRQPLWEGMLKELSRITPENIRLTSLEIVPGALPIQLRLQGEIIPTYTSVEVLYSQYQLTLERSAFFSEIRLVSMKKDLYSAVPRAVFELTCRLAY